MHRRTAYAGSLAKHDVAVATTRLVGNVLVVDAHMLPLASILTWADTRAAAVFHPDPAHCQANAAGLARHLRLYERVMGDE